MYEPLARVVPCEDVRRVDIRALSFRIRDNINPHTPDLEIRIRDGGSSGDDVPQWYLYGFRDRRMALHDGTLLRVVSIFVGRGTGEHGYVFALSCRDGKLHDVFQAGGEGMRPILRPGGEDAIRLRWGVWRKGDSHAEPSRERIQDFAWVPSFGQFAIIHDEERAIRRPGQP